jgi:hypothetical protein
MKFVTNIPLTEIRPGDHFDAEIECLVDKRPIWRRCKLVSIHGHILRVTTATRKGVVTITRDKIRSDHAWGDR